MLKFFILVFTPVFDSGDLQKLNLFGKDRVGALKKVVFSRTRYFHSVRKKAEYPPFLIH